MNYKPTPELQKWWTANYAKMRNDSSFTKATIVWNAATAAASAAAPQVVADEPRRLRNLISQYNELLGVEDSEDRIADAHKGINKLEEKLRDTNRAAAPVQAQEPVAAAISYWTGPTNENGVPVEVGFANMGKWSDFEPTTLKHGKAIKERGDPEKRVKFLFDSAPVQPVAVPDGWQAAKDAYIKLTNSPIVADGEACYMADNDIMSAFDRFFYAAPAAQGDAISQQQIAEIIDSYTDQGTKETSIDDAAEAILAAIAAKAAS